MSASRKGTILFLVGAAITLLILLIGFKYNQGYIYKEIRSFHISSIFHKNESPTPSDKTATYTVTLTADGFKPNELTINQGDTVIFKTNLGIPFWPASSLHPTHKIYPEFDPKGRIMPPENWAFTFGRVGKWKYHDHINERDTGTIIVLGNNSSTSSSSVSTDCKNLNGYEKQQCWDNQLSLVLKESGIKEAFKFFAQLYKTEPDVPKACHEWGHKLGEAAYKKYKETGELILVPEASYCGYGYFHSFIAELVKDTGDYSKVLEFCNVVEDKLHEQLKSIHRNCVHGVGHGTTAWLLENPENWGKFQKTVNEGTAICERVYKNQDDLGECYDGVFNEIHLDLFNDRYGFSFADFMSKNDPFWICQEQKDRHRGSCYFEFVGIFWKIFDMDLMKAILYVSDNTHDIEKNGPTVISKIAADWIQFDIVNKSQERNILACRAIPKSLFDSCIEGIANGFIQHGDPLNLHTKGFAFCQADYLTSSERALCLKDFTQLLRWYYTKEQFKSACALLPEKELPESCTGT